MEGEASNFDPNVNTQPFRGRKPDPTVAQLQARLSRSKTLRKDRYTVVINATEKVVKLVCLLCGLQLCVSNISTAQESHSGACALQRALDVGAPPPPNPYEPMVPADVVDDVKKELALFFYTSGTAFARADNPHMKRALKLLGVDSPSAKQLRTTYLNNTHAVLQRRVATMMETLLMWNGGLRNWSAWGRLFDDPRRSGLDMASAEKLIFIQTNDELAANYDSVDQSNQQDTARAPAPDQNATDQRYAIRVAMTMVVGPNETLVTFLPGRERWRLPNVYAPLTVSVPTSAASPLANLEVLNLYNPSSTSAQTPVDVGGAALVKPSPVVPSLNRTVTTLAAASTAANATLAALGELVAAVAGLAETVVVTPGRLDGGGGAPGLRASSLAGQSLVVAAELLASGANNALAAAAALGANVDTLVTVTAAQQASVHAMRANILAKSFSNSMPAASAIAALPPPVTTGPAGALPEVAVAAAEAGAAAQAAVKAAGSGSLQDAVNAAWVAAEAAVSAMSQALAIALAAAPEDKPVRIQSGTNATFVTRRDATSVAQAMAAAASCGSAALAVQASAALVAQEVLPSARTRGLNSNMSATPAGLDDGAMLNVAARAAAAANATSTAALGVVTVATNPNPSPSPSPNPSPSPPSSSFPSFTPIDNALYAIAMAAEGVYWARQLDWKKWGVSIGMDEYPYLSGFTRPFPEPVAIIAAPSSSCPARLVAVREASELPDFRDGTKEKVTSFFDNSTGVVTSQGMVWLNTYTSLGNASILPGMLASFLPATAPEDIQGLSGCPLGTDLDRLMRRAAGDTSVVACSSSRSALPWRAALALKDVYLEQTTNHVKVTVSHQAGPGWFGVLHAAT
ncbi:hypothetical protein QJQ45_013327 [Haematococcus lacustris]|nr:hypothetical protein QJQ45_013327 [Haematococcus lacustris]